MGECTHAFTAYTHHTDKDFVYTWCDACNKQIGISKNTTGKVWNGYNKKEKEKK